MNENIVTFALRNAPDDEMGHALAQCHAEYLLWHSQATTIMTFAGDARLGDVHSILQERTSKLLYWAKEAGLIQGSTDEKYDAIANEISKHQISTAEFGVKLASTVIIHNALERFLWRLIRFGIVLSRPKAIELIAKRSIRIEDLTSQDGPTCIDAQLEKWWNELERKCLQDKWKCLVGLVGFPTKLVDPPDWHFDEKTLTEFDSVRHNAVHNDGKTLSGFNLDGFASQVLRSQAIWVLHIACELKLSFPPEAFFLRK